MNRKIHVIGGSEVLANWMEGEIVNTMAEADLVAFDGGEDVTPSLYGEPAHPRTGNNLQRDAEELSAFAEAQSLGKKIIGICRGSQFLCVMAGGKLVQDQEVQPMYHLMQTYAGEQILVSSTHHQAQWPWNLKSEDRKLLGWTRGLSKWHEDGRQKEIVNDTKMGNRPEVEVCYYPKIKSLAIQPHPEFYATRTEPQYTESIAFFRQLLDKHMSDKL